MASPPNQQYFAGRDDTKNNQQVGDFVVGGKSDEQIMKEIAPLI